MASFESFPQSEIPQPNSLLETHGDVPVTIDGVTMPLKIWFGFCPVPHEEMDPVKIEETAQAFLDGRNPFGQK